MNNNNKNISDFYVAGINYRKTDATIRGQFAINNDQYTLLLSKASSFGLDELFILSTCNRTEIFGFATKAEQLIDLLCSETAGDKETFLQLAYSKNGLEAIEHLFNVAAGLDSQILGDYEIIGQIKQAAKFAKEYGFIGAFTERLINSVLQSSKNIKNHTQLSGGTVSVSFAAVQYIREKIKAVSDKKILLIGIGKIGRNTCRNLIDYLHTRNITLINRTEIKAAELAGELSVQYAGIEDLPQHIRDSEIILVATDATEPMILKSHLLNQENKLVIDFSIPYNVDISANELPNVDLVNVDQLSRLKDETLQKREAEVPKAKAIITATIHEFMEWYEMRKHVPILKAVKNTLQEIHSNQHHTFASAGEQKTNANIRIQKVINMMAIKMRHQNQRGCHYIEAINEFIATGTD